ncbi:tripartite tricarboxylate transporter TctB family protein [Halorubrum sp. DTA98]|uniref:tripartite tricarboxylate transporter TctB family protein n=1 Tax=Halorubrum sp. DTA98 TaxID=3402163 RepID=UPI003AB08698
MSTNNGRFRIELKEVKRNLWEERQFLGLLAGMLVFFGYYYYLTLDFSQPQTSFLPRIVLGLGITTVVLNILVIAFNDQIEEIRGSESKSVADELLEERASDDEYSVVSLLKETSWIIGYIATVYYVGFFTVTLIFVFLYGLTHFDEISPRSVAFALLVSVSLNAFLYFLFITIMNSGAILRVGRFI